MAPAETVLPGAAYLFAISGNASAQQLLKTSIFGLVAHLYCRLLFNKLLLLKGLFLVIVIETLPICNSKSHDAN